MQGWRSDTLGYLSENALVTAIAIFEKRFGGTNKARVQLLPYLQSVHKKTHRCLDKEHPRLQHEMAEFDLAAWA